MKKRLWGSEEFRILDFGFRISAHQPPYRNVFHFFPREPFHFLGEERTLPKTEKSDIRIPKWSVCRSGLHEDRPPTRKAYGEGGERSLPKAEKFEIRNPKSDLPGLPVRSSRGATSNPKGAWRRRRTNAAKDRKIRNPKFEIRYLLLAGLGHGLRRCEGRHDVVEDPDHVAGDGLFFIGRNHQHPDAGVVG